ncbi:MAG: dihydroorotate dehydrogenase-like protein [Deltaproteobacteria bacterium]|nr:dihydroorotate dehydrogenase-like protein [Deltaproteobacteria bacterium]
MDLSTTYLGLKLRNPLVVSSSSLCDSVDKLKALEEAGAGAVVLKSLFEEQIILEGEQMDATTSTAESFPEATSYFADIPMEIGPQQYVALVSKAKKALGIPVIASLNCVTAKNWAKYARQIESAGADALELNVYFLPTDPSRTSAQIEGTYLQIVEQVRKTVDIPVAVKLSPFFTAIPHMVSEISKRGVNGVVLFNRFYQPNLDLEEMKASSQLHLSRPEDCLLPMRWIALMYGRVKIDFAATTGIHDGKSALKVLMAGANVAQVCSVLFKHKAQHLSVMLRDMEAWLKEKEYASLSDIRGVLSQKTCPDPEAFERAQYIKIIVGHD